MGFQISVVHAVLQEQFVSKDSIITFKCLFYLIINIITANRKFIYTFLFHSFSAKNATSSPRESMKIDEQKLDLYIGSIIEATASSLGDIVVRVSSSTEQSEKDFDNGSASSLNLWES